VRDDKVTEPEVISPIAKFINNRISELKKEGLTQRDIASAIGYNKPNILSMMKNGETKVPIDKVPAFARALRCDPVYLYRLAMQQYWPEETELLSLVTDCSITKNERQLMDYIRELSNENDPVLDENLRAKLQQVFA